MIESLRKLYDAEKLANEIEGIASKPETPKESNAKPKLKKKK